MGLIRNYRLLTTISPYMDRIGKELSMPLSWNMIFQAVATGIQGTNAISPMFPHDTQVAIALGVAVVQAAIAFIAHFTNPDGTSASVAYTPPK